MLPRLSLIFSCLALVCAAFQCHNGPDKRATMGSIQLWTSNTVPYEIGAEYTPDQKKLIRDSLNEISTLTSNCVRFIDHTSRDTVWVKVVSKTGCWSSVGMSRNAGLQELSLDRSGCMTKDTIMHEFMHALGFNHEQTRPDRDNYVKVLYENIQPAYKFAFDIIPDAKLQSVGLPYDFGSVMHYAYWSFSTDGLPTMATAAKKLKDWRYNMGNATTLSSYDVLKIKTIYGCSG